MSFAARVALSKIVQYGEEIKGWRLGFGSAHFSRSSVVDPQSTRLPRERPYGRRETFSTLTRGGSRRLKRYRGIFSIKSRWIAMKLRLRGGRGRMKMLSGGPH